MTRTQIDRLTSRVEQLATVLEPESVAQVPVYDGETEEEALAAYEEERGLLERGRRIVFERICGQTRAEVGPMDHLINCMSPGELRAKLKEIDGKTRGLPWQYERTNEKE